MRLKSNRILMSMTDIYNIINAQAKTKLDLSFLDKSNYIPLDNLEADIDLILKRNLPYSRVIIDALRNGKIIICSANNLSSSVSYVYGMDKSNTNIEKVFININRISKIESKVTALGEIEKITTIIGGYEMLYNALYGAYVGLKAKEVWNSAAVTNSIREIYVDMFAQIVSRNFGNPIDGDKFRFMVSHFFYNGELTGKEVASLIGFQLDKVIVLESKYNDWFAKRDELKLSEFITVLAEEFQSLQRQNLEPKAFVIACVTALGDNGVYMMDNFAYLLTVMATKARKSKIFQGYMLKNIESEAASLLSVINRNL